MGIGAITFDLDDTLAVVDRSRADLLEAAIRAVDAPPISRTQYLDAHASVRDSETRAPIFELLLSTVGDSDVDPVELAGAYRQAIGSHLRPVRGVESMLESLSASMPVGLITNGPERAQLDKLERLGWTDRFDAVVITGRLGTPKPEPEPFHAACDCLGVSPSEVVHVGDHPVHDIDGARAAGLDAVWVVEEDTHRHAPVPTVTRERLAEELVQLAQPVVH